MQATEQHEHDWPAGGASLMVALRLRDKLVVVIGSGHVSNARVRSALEADARVRVVCPAPTPELRGLLEHTANRQRLEWLPRSLKRVAWRRDVGTNDDDDDEQTPLAEADFADADLLLSTIDDEDVSQAIAEACRSRRIPVTCADIPDSCDFWMASVHRDGPLQIAVSSNGAGPKLASLLREHIAATIPACSGRAIATVGLLRQIVRWITPEKSASPRRMRWLSSLCSAMSMEQLAALDDQHIAGLLSAYCHRQPVTADSSLLTLAASSSSPSSQCPLLPLRRALDGSAAESESLRTRWMVDLAGRYPIATVVQALHDPAALAQLVEQFRSGQAGAIAQPAADSTPAGKRTEEEEPRSKDTVKDSAVDDSQAAPQTQTSGEIALVSCGPGDPELLTVKAVRCIAEADVVLADVLVSMDVLKHARPDAEVYVAEKRDCGQDEGQSRLFRLALAALQQGKRVARLKGGDSFLFGRGGEEVVFFRQHGYNPVVVPGVSALLAAPAAMSVPVTYRHIADQLVVLTGVGSGGAWPANIPDYAPNRTLVIFMAVSRLAAIARDHLIARHGYPDSTPAAIVENATLPTQRQLFATLATIGDLAAAHKIQSPATVVIGWTALPDVLRPDELLS